MAGDWVSGKRTLVGSLLWFTVLQSVPVSQPTGHGNQLQLIYKNHPVVRIRISEATNCKAKCKTDHNWEQIPKQRFMSDHIGNILVCETMTHCFFVCFFSAIMLIFFMWVELFLGLTFLHPDTIVKTSYLRFICISETPTKLVVGCC